MGATPIGAAPPQATEATGSTSISAAIAAIAEGGIVVVLDDEDREDEADLIMAAQFASAEQVAFFLAHTSGFLCVSMPPDRARTLALDPMVEENTEFHRTAFLTSVDLRAGTTTGISAVDRSLTIRALADPATQPEDLARPGHVMPLAARRGGVLKRAGHTEAAVDLCQLAGVHPVGLLAELVTPDRVDMMRGPAARAFAAEHGLPVLTIASLIGHLRRTRRIVERAGEATIPTAVGDFRAIAFRGTLDDSEHLALVMGDVGRVDASGQTEGPAADDAADEILVRVHSECITGDVMGSLRCDCGDQLRAAMAIIAENGRGVIVYLRGHEGRGIGLGHKLRAYQLQSELNLDTVDANLALGLPVDSREYGVGAQILADLGVRNVRLLTNNPRKYGGLEGYGIRIVAKVPLITPSNPHNASYLATKRDRLGHELDSL